MACCNGSCKIIDNICKIITILFVVLVSEDLQLILLDKIKYVLLTIQRVNNQIHHLIKIIKSVTVM